MHDEQPHPHPHPHPVWKRQGTLAEIFAKMMCFLKQGKKKGRPLNTGIYKPILISQGLWLEYDIEAENPSNGSGFPQIQG